jgi:thiol-disulfide isomerase/thioredoxin
VPGPTDARAPEPPSTGGAGTRDVVASVRNTGSDRHVDLTVTTDRLRLTADDLGSPLGPRATLVQFSSTFCAPCRATRRILERVVATDDGVAHVELDVADHPDLGRALAIDVTPTVLVLDADGVLVRRASGAPSLAQARAAVELAARQPTSSVPQPS